MKSFIFALCHYILSTSLCLAFINFNAARRITRFQSKFKMSESDSEGGVDALRKMLEASWNTQSMGVVPTSADSAASAAAESVLAAFEREKKAVFFVDVLLPQYDLAQGERMYDEVSAVDLCISLARQLEGKTEIVVRDARTVDVVSRVLDIREGNPDAFDDSEDSDDGRDDSRSEETNQGPIGKGDTNSVEDFRSQLMSSWDSAESDKDKTDKGPPRKRKKRSERKAGQYRLTSLLGDTEIKIGPDMTEPILKAVSANAKPKDDEDTIIILSSISQQELVGVRALVGKYKASRRIVLVNCRFERLPRELVDAKTVYSILPLIARPKDPSDSIFSAGSRPTEDESPSKVVVMRRYPGDWEVYVDIGGGFELAATCPAARFQKLPPMDWIASSVKRFLQTAR